MINFTSMARIASAGCLMKLAHGSANLVMDSLSTELTICDIFSRHQANLTIGILSASLELACAHLDPHSFEEPPATVRTWKKELVFITAALTALSVADHYILYYHANCFAKDSA